MDNVEPRTVTMTPEAVRLWIDWRQRHFDETAWACFPAQLKGVWTKFDAHALTLVLIVHILKVACDHCASGKEYSQIDPPIDQDSVTRGLRLADYFKNHVARVFTQLKVTPEDRRAEQVLNWVRNQPAQWTTPRKLVQNGVAGIKTVSEARTVLGDLEDRRLGTCERQNNKIKDFQASEP
jgi:hypothetical protein